MPHVRSPETVASALRASDDGVADAQNAELHGVAVKTIRRWRREYQRRGRPRGQTHLAPPCPRCDGAPLDPPAYAELLGWYLGDGYLSRGRRDVFNLHVYNDARYVEVNAHIATVMAVVKPGGRPHTRVIPGCLVTTVSWKHWPCLFPQHGPGRKHERPIVLEDWQRAIVAAQPGFTYPPLSAGRTHQAVRHGGRRWPVAGTGPPERGTSGGVVPGRRRPRCRDAPGETADGEARVAAPSWMS